MSQKTIRLYGKRWNLHEMRVSRFDLLSLRLLIGASGFDQHTKLRLSSHQ